MRPTLRFCTAVGMVLAFGIASFGSSDGASGWPPIAAAPAPCCRVCTKGKACGDSCIARDKDCHRPPGCACDAAD